MKSGISYLRHYLKIIRPLNVLISIISIWVAALISSQFHVNTRLILGGLVAALITCGANIINDIYDIQIDRINKPGRLLPSGAVSTETAWKFFYFSYGLALIIAVFSGWDMFFVASLVAACLYWYSAVLKRTILWGNIMVSFSTGVAFIYGAMAVYDWPAGIIPGIFAFFFHFGREIIKDMQDIEGDLSENAVTFAGKKGMKSSIALVNLIFILLITLTIVPYILNIYNLTYLFVVVFGVDLVLLIVSISIWKWNDHSALGKWSHLLKLDMVVGLIAIYLGS
ncbi:MAG: geranylgeranylglycerol-phosphate geranylgeranyltransferase [Calditrichaceae bacterium]